jgi:hypothetical protein
MINYVIVLEFFTHEGCKILFSLELITLIFHFFTFKINFYFSS